MLLIATFVFDMPYEGLIFHAFFPRHLPKKFQLSESESLAIFVKTSPLILHHYFKFLCSVLRPG